MEDQESQTSLDYTEVPMPAWAIEDPGSKSKKKKNHQIDQTLHKSLGSQVTGIINHTLLMLSKATQDPVPVHP